VSAMNHMATFDAAGIGERQNAALG
jgi:hypothetical protein